MSRVKPDELHVLDGAYAGAKRPGDRREPVLIYDSSHIIKIFNEIENTSLNIAPLLPHWFGFQISQISDEA